MCVLVRGRDIQQIRSSSILIKLIVSNSVLVTASKALVTRSDALVPSSEHCFFETWRTAGVQR